VTRLWLENVIVEILKAKFLEEQDLKNLEELLGTHSKDCGREVHHSTKK